jgi:dinuclear metal center YbgI/SA1388 family protein
MHRDALVGWLDTLLGTDRVGREYKDPALNGLQVEGGEKVTKVGAAVDAAQATFDQAASQGVDFLIVHHGLFWGGQQAVVGRHKRRLETLLRAGISLYASHAPLDVHPDLGNNALLAGALGLIGLEPFEWGYIGHFEQSQSLSSLGDQLGQITGMQVLVHQGGSEDISRVGIISGGGASYLEKAKALGCDVFITGEPKHSSFHDTFEMGINAIYAGHYDTETFGVKALAKRIETDFGIPWVFLDHPTGL